MDTVYLMYHEIEQPGRALASREPGYVRYVVGEADFRAQLHALRSGGFRGLSVGQHLAATGSAEKQVVITFDDGCASDLLTAAPLLAEAGFGATFYVVTGFLGRPGFLTEAQVRELAGAGFEIGSHSVSHRYLSELPEGELRKELAESRERLEQITGTAVEHFSCPGGRWDPRVSELAREVEYRSLATSRIGANGPAADRFQLARVAVRQGDSAEAVARVARGGGLRAQQVQSAMLGSAKRLLGNRLYEGVRGRLLGGAGG